MLFKLVLVNVENQYVWKQLQMLCASETEAITVIKNKRYNTGSYWPQTVHTEAATVGWEPVINRNWGPSMLSLWMKGHWTWNREKAGDMVAA